MAVAIDVRKIRIAPNHVRDYFRSWELSSTKYVPLWEKEGVVGLDWGVFNRGASSITVLVDDSHTITVPSNSSRTVSNAKFGSIKVTGSENYTLMVAGVSRELI